MSDFVSFESHLHRKKTYEQHTVVTINNKNIEYKSLQEKQAPFHAFCYKDALISVHHLWFNSTTIFLDF